MTRFVFSLLALIAFVVLGIVWSGDPDDTVAALWVVSFVLVVAAALVPGDGKDDAGLGSLWERLPAPSKNPDDYR